MRVVGIGAGHPDQVTVEAVSAMRAARFALVARKSDDDPLVEARRALVARHAPDLPIVTVRDPERDRRKASTATRDGYERVVADWHDARAEAFEAELLARDGDAVFLTWGDPAFYDSTIRIVERILARGRVTFAWDVLPGISALQLLAARHRIVLHEVGQPILVTTERRLADAVAGGADNVLVMLTSGVALDGLDDWYLWWGADLGTPHERLVAGRVGDVRDDVEAARTDVKARAGWVMDVFLLRRTAPAAS
ncbi:precorrin-6A synthase (deacetylating) [Aeromicrobium halocynthiae]|uniref:Precorrin-6A synthase (Deacetylating) n=1 Tax=Aeromicrobium halocynthiae TaxID=560557 RepID=A0ABN2VVR9_9ACTN